MKRILAAVMLACCILPFPLHAERIDRKAVVTRHQPHVTSLDALSALTVGNGGFAFTVDATGLQTFAQAYRQGVCLGTFSDWGWHAFPNTQGYKEQEAWVKKDFGRGHEEWYAAQFKEKGRQQEAADYFRVNPHRMHLGNVGLDLAEASQVKDIDQQLDLWTGQVRSRFRYGGQQYRVQTVCAPHRDLLATKVTSNGRFGVIISFAYPTGGHSDDACDWTKDALHSTRIISQTGNTATLERMVDDTRYYVSIAWKGKAQLVTLGRNKLKLQCPAGTLQLQCEFLPTAPKTPAPFLPFNSWAGKSATWWAGYWGNGGFIDLGHVTDPRAKELERRIVLSQYLMGAQEHGPQPPQETGLTYNSWFGKFHLEMTWWHLAHYGLWNRAALLDRPLSWYLQAENKARAIARRQGFRGVRWMKMTDPEAGEAPSNVGSYLIWQQPHLIYLAELLYRAASAHADSTTLHRQLLDKYGRLVEETAEMMADFAEYDTARQRYILRGCIPAQETLKADSTTNPPFELNYWLVTLKMAQQWRQRQGMAREARWDGIIARLSPLAYNADSLYLAAETATQTYTDRRFTSDHPALLGALGILPATRITNDTIMRRTLHWIWDNWNWPTSWGWDFPMTAMTCARLGEPSRAVDALLMNEQKNTYLVNGHNYQDDRLRIYMPGNGGLLTAVAMMAAGWDGSRGHAPGFPADWDVRYEDLLPMP